MGLTTGKIAEVMFENMVETYEHQTMMLDLVDAEQGDSEKLQNAGNTIWYPVQQHRPVLTGFDLTGQEQGIIEETYPISLGDPNGDLIEQRIDNMRDQRFWERAGTQAGFQQATQLNKDLLDLVVDTGSLHYRFDFTTQGTSGFDFISEGQALVNERQVYKTLGCNFILNDRDTKAFASELAGRETIKGRPSDTWLTGQIGSQVAEFDVFTSSSLKNLAGGAIATSTVDGDVSEAPEGGSANATTKVVTNIDYRLGTIPVVSSAAYAVGDIVTFINDPGGTPVIVESLGLADKNETGEAMTFKIVGIPGATSVEVFPKPIAADDAGLSTLEKAYANINTQILDGATVVKVNLSTERSNAFFAKDSIQVMGGEVPWELMNEFGGMQVIKKPLTSGVTIYMIYDGDMIKGTFQYRFFVWYGLANRNPMANGSAVTFSS